MTQQLMLSAFSQKTISMTESTKSLRPWNNIIFDWDVDYLGYSRGPDEPEGIVEYHVVVELSEALVNTRNPKTNKKVERPGYKLIITQNIAIEGRGWESYVVYEESFQKDKLKKAFDLFQREVLNIQGWTRIAESRFHLIPKGLDVFECVLCGWVTDVWSDDITCEGCGKRYWSEKLWKGENHGQ